ncbi:MAG: ExeM/NucH family extracellular endonuclease [Methylovulum sp.]|nr:ExeM/NucH family extracellular endonuclease [Methylovulum sp.]
MTEKQLIKRHPLALAVLAALNFYPVAHAIPVGSDLVISQVYGGGGNSGATFKNDFIELFNRGSSAVSLNGMSVQYASSTGTSWASKTDLPNVTLQPGQYYLVQEAAGTGGTTDLPTPDTIGTVAMSGTNGKVALVSSQTALTGSCPTAGVVDFIGYGTANCSETSAAPGLGNTTADLRASNGCTDTDNNNSDFATGTPNPRNTATAVHLCAAPGNTVNLSVSSNTGTEAGTTAITVTATASAAVTSDQTVDLAVTGTGITAGDYTLSNTTITILNGGTTGSVTFTVVDDAVPEVTETAVLTISNPSAGLALGATTTQNIDITDNDGSVTPNLSINDVSQNEGNSGTSNYAFTISLSSPAPAGGVSFDIATADSSATTADSDYVSQSLTGQTIPAGSSSYTFNVTVNGDTTIESDETFLVNVTNVSGATLTDGQGTGTLVNDDVAPCSAVDTPIGQIQGSGAAAVLTGVQTVQGVVVGDYEGASPALRGFYLQNAPANSDGDDATSDAIFVFDNGADNVSLGQVVQVTGTVAEFQDQTQMTAGGIEFCGSTGTITPVGITFPVPAVDYLERFEGMLVQFPQTLYVTEHFQLGRFGQVVLSSGNKLAQPTNVANPGAAALAQQAANFLNRIIVDDELQNQNRDPIVFGRGGNPLTASNTLRGGDTVKDVIGVMTYTWAGNAASGNAYRLRPINALNGGAPNFVAANPRPTVPAQVNGTLKVVSANLLNFFDDFTNCGFGTSDPAPATATCRGAENQTELDRQWPKTVENLVGTGADVIAVNEMENNGYGANSAIQFLVNKLNAKAGAGTYAFIDVDTATSEIDALGTDAIKVGMIYKPATVTPVGTTAALNTGAFGIFRTGAGDFGRSRPSLAQAFEENETGARFIAVANHFKSKGSSCADNVSMLSLPILSTIDVTNDTDAGDGQGNCNKTRTAAAQELMALLATDPTGTGDPDILIVGDLNSYAKEDPITTIKNGGYTNLIESRIGAAGYSYAFDGQWGYLDHALASSSLASQVQDVLEWHINSDEPSVLDYNTNFKTARQLASLYAADAFRTSDHDPIIVGLNLTAPPLNTVSGTKNKNKLIGSSGRDVITGFDREDTLTGGGDRDQFVYRSIKDGIDTITDFTVNYDKIVMGPLLQSLGIASLNPLADGYVVCSDLGADSTVWIDRDAGGPFPKRKMVQVNGVACNALMAFANFKF